MRVLHLFDSRLISEPVRLQISALIERDSSFVHEPLPQGGTKQWDIEADMDSVGILHLWSPPASARVQKLRTTAQIVVIDKRDGASGASSRALSRAKKGARAVAEILPSETWNVVETSPGLFEARMPFGVPHSTPTSGQEVRARFDISSGTTVVAIALSAPFLVGPSVRIALQLCRNCSPQQDNLIFLPLGSPEAKKRFFAAAAEAQIGDRLLRADEADEADEADMMRITDVLWIPGSDGAALNYARWATTLAIPIVGHREQDPVRAIGAHVASPRERHKQALQNQAAETQIPTVDAASDMMETLYAHLLSDAGLPAPLARKPGDYRAAAPFRIAMVTQEDPFYIPLFFQEFFRLAAERRSLNEGDGTTATPAPAPVRAGGEIPTSGRPVEIEGLMIQRPLGNKTSKGLAKRIWRLYGTWGFLRMGMRYLGATLAGRLLPGRTVGGAAKAAGVPLLPMSDANGEAFLSFVRENQIDLVVSVSASQIFKGEILYAPTHGCINLHNAPLPHYRGMLPNFWQIYHRENQSVLTIHQMVADLDKGDILLQRATPITEEMSLEDLIRTTKRRSARALWHLLDRFATQSVEVTPLPKEEGSYFSWPTREEAREFRRRGRKLL